MACLSFKYCNIHSNHQH